MERYEINKYLNDFEIRIEDLKTSLNLDKIKSEYKQLSQVQLEPGFWDDVKQAQETIEKTNDIKEQIDTIEDLQGIYEDIYELFELTEEGSVEWDLIEEEIVALEKSLKAFELLTLLNGPYDKNDCILELHPGAGGTESQDWCEMLYRMYSRYASRHRYKVDLLDLQPGEEAGIKSVTIKIKGKYAYGNLKSEVGVHRLVRISPFDSNKRRHTSFVSCDVTPIIEDLSEIIINDEDIRVDVYRSSGAGGQSVNTTDSAVRITHLPTGIVVTCQNERSQLQNKTVAMNILKSKLATLHEAERIAELEGLKGTQKDIAWGSQIRSYVFHPYQMVKDHRTGAETAQTDLVMDGDIDSFINSYLKQVVK